MDANNVVVRKCMYEAEALEWCRVANTYESRGYRS